MIGDGDLGEVVIEAKGRDVALFQASDGLDRESHLTTGRRRQGNLARGRYRTGCVSIRGMRDHESKHRMRRNSRRSQSPRLLRNRIHDGKMLASMWTTTARGTLEDNDIFGNAFSAVEIKME